MEKSYIRLVVGAMDSADGLLQLISQQLGSQSPVCPSSDRDVVKGKPSAVRTSYYLPDGASAIRRRLSPKSNPAKPELSFSPDQ
jgi:hypothetical protein